MLNITIGFSILLIFSLLILTQKVDKYIYFLIVYLILASFITKVVYFTEPIEGKNFINGAKGYLILVLFISIFLRNNVGGLIKTKIGLPILLYIAIFSAFAFLGPGDFGENRKQLMGAPLLMSFYFIGLQYFSSEARIKRFFKFFIIFYTLNILYANYQQIFGLLAFEKKYLLSTAGRIEFINDIDPITGQLYYKVMGFSGFNYSLFYILTMFSIILLAAREFFEKNLGKKIYYFLFSYLVLLTLSLERTPIMMFGTLPLAFIKEKKKFIAYIILIVAFVSVLNTYKYELLSYGSSKINRFVEIASPISKETSLSYRMEKKYTYTVPLIFKNPFGIGVSNEEAVGAHNNYIKIFLQVGWFGGLLFLFILIRAVLLCYQNYRVLKNNEYSKLIMGVLAAMFAMFAAGIPNIPFGYDCAIFFWLFLGMVENLPKIYQQNHISII